MGASLSNERWLLQRDLVHLDEELLAKAAKVLREHGQMTSTQVAQSLFPREASPARLRTRAMSVGTGLEGDREKRFVVVAQADNLTWALSPPPREVTITLDGDCVHEGYLPLSQGLQWLLFYYGLDRVAVVTSRTLCLGISSGGVA